jgi:hypothetical protein
MLEDHYIDGVGGWPPPTPPAEKAVSPRLAARPTMMLSFRFSDEAMNATSFRFLREAMGVGCTGHVVRALAGMIPFEFLERHDSG